MVVGIPDGRATEKNFCIFPQIAILRLRPYVLLKTESKWLNWPAVQNKHLGFPNFARRQTHSDFQRCRKREAFCHQSGHQLDKCASEMSDSLKMVFTVAEIASGWEKTRKTRKVIFASATAVLANQSCCSCF